MPVYEPKEHNKRLHFIHFIQDTLFFQLPNLHFLSEKRLRRDNLWQGKFPLIIFYLTIIMVTEFKELMKLNSIGA